MCVKKMYKEMSNKIKFFPEYIKKSDLHRMFRRNSKQIMYKENNNA